MVRGHFAGLPWRREFAYFLNDDGFYSRDADRSGTDVTVQGGFIVQSTGDDECTLIHYEVYNLSPWFVPLKPLIRAYLKWSMRKELRDIRTAVMHGVKVLADHVNEIHGSSEPVRRRGEFDHGLG